MPTIKFIYIGIVAVTIAVRLVILAKNIQTYLREGEEGVRAEAKRAAVEKMKRQIQGGY